MASANGAEVVDERLRQLLADADPTGDRVAFLGCQFDLGLAWVHFPEGHGGLGAAPAFQRRVDEAIAVAGGPSPWLTNPIGHGMAAPTVLTHGSEDQQRRYLRPLFTGEEIWCQLFSEPGAGSDVASLATRAERDGDEWMVNGQKVWTTVAHLARYGLLLARTDPDAVKHKGLTYFVVDMHAPGVDVRPLRQLTGDAEFNEVYFTDVRIPDGERLGEVGQGWHASLTTLMNERVSLGGVVRRRGSGPIATAVRLWQDSAARDPVSRDRVARLWIEAEVLRLTTMRAESRRHAGVPGPEGSVAKLMAAELNQRIADLCVDLIGADGMLYDSYEMQRTFRFEPAQVQRSFLRSRANSIEGGTSEIMRNILGERVLGLPGDVRVDKDRPWSDVPR